MVMDSKYRQLNEKTLLCQHQFSELEGQKHTLEENYSQLKQVYKQAKEEFLELKYELEKAKEAVRFNPVVEEGEEKDSDTELLIMKEMEGLVDLKNLL
jgi:predicted nuclease with TOPRIM domain